MAAFGKGPGRLAPIDWERVDARKRFRESDYSIKFSDDACDGPGWYWLHVPFPTSGWVGPFQTRGDAIASAREWHCEY